MKSEWEIIDGKNRDLTGIIEGDILNIVQKNKAKKELVISCIKEHFITIYRDLYDETPKIKSNARLYTGEFKRELIEAIKGIHPLYDDWNIKLNRAGI